MRWIYWNMCYWTDTDSGMTEKFPQADKDFRVNSHSAVVPLKVKLAPGNFLLQELGIFQHLFQVKRSRCISVWRCTWSDLWKVGYSLEGLWIKGEWCRLSLNSTECYETEEKIRTTKPYFDFFVTGVNPQLVYLTSVKLIQILRVHLIKKAY